MKYMLLINLGPKARDHAAMTDEERQAFYAAWGEVNATPGLEPGTALSPPDTATTVRVQDGKTLTTDGPYVETKEALDGYCFIEADNLDDAIAVAAKIPATSMGGAVEVRPIGQW